MRKVNQLTTAEIQKEQLFLVQLERELSNVLDKINENLNTLKVEELQIRSNAVSVNQMDVQQDENINKQEETVFNDNPEVINRQELDLDIFLSRIGDEEEDEDN